MLPHICDVLTRSRIHGLITAKASRVRRLTCKPSIKNNNEKNHCQEMVLTWRAINNKFEIYYKLIVDIILGEQSWNRLRWNLCTNGRHGTNAYGFQLYQQYKKYFNKIKTKHMICWLSLPPVVHDEILQWIGNENIRKTRKICLFWHLPWQRYFENDLWHSVWAMMSTWNDNVDDQKYQFISKMGYRKFLQCLIFDKRVCDIKILQKIRQEINGDSVTLQKNIFPLDDAILQYITSYLRLTDYLHFSQTCYFLWFKMGNAQWLSKIWSDLTITCAKYKTVNPSISSRWWLQYHNNVSFWFSSCVPYESVFPLWRLKYITNYCGNVLHVSNKEMNNDNIHLIWWDNTHGDHYHQKLHIQNVSQFILSDNVYVRSNLRIDSKIFVCARGCLRALILSKQLQNEKCETIVLWMTTIIWNMNNVRKRIDRQLCNKHLIYIVGDKYMSWQTLINVGSFSIIAQRLRKITLVFRWDTWNTQGERTLLKLLNVNNFANLFEIHIVAYFSTETQSDYAILFTTWFKKTLAERIYQHINIGICTISCGISDTEWYTFDVKKCWNENQLAQHLSNALLLPNYPHRSNNDMIWCNLVNCFL